MQVMGNRQWQVKARSGSFCFLFGGVFRRGDFSFVEMT